LRAMLNGNSMRALYDDAAKRTVLKPEADWAIEQGLGLSAQAAFAASVARSDWYAAAHRLFARYDALALPAAQVWPFTADWRWRERAAVRLMVTYHGWMQVVIPASLIGLPALCAPAGFWAAGMPMGMQLIGTHGAEAAILALGQA